MNDFTKEELEAICYDLKHNENPWQCGETIINKIQSLIENYCQHSIAIYIGTNGAQVSCQKCKKDIND